MAIISLLSAAVIIFLLYTANADFDSSNNDHDDWSTLLFLRKVAQILGAAILGSSVEDNEGEADGGQLSHLSKYAGTSFGRLCSGEALLPADVQPRLKCRYVDHGIPFLKIGPLREEEAYLDPRIVLYHDVIYEQEIEDIKIMSEPMLEKAKIGRGDADSEMSEDRISKSSWLEDYRSPSLKLLKRRVEYITGLTTDSAEELQIAHYEIGGLYEDHTDFVPDEDVDYFGKRGNRIATFLFYLNDVQKGGATVFTELNVTIWPRKGSALFWYNLKRNGQGDELTMHGACPVLLGTKWIATRWLHEKGQEFRRPCSLFEDE